LRKEIETSDTTIMDAKPGKPSAPSEETLIRERLAYVRTALANERTLLAYIRSGLGFFAAGATLIHFLENHSERLFGIGLCGIGLASLIYGIAHFYRTRTRINRIMEP
jgi:putative membrane protein